MKQHNLVHLRLYIVYIICQNFVINSIFENAITNFTSTDNEAAQLLCDFFTSVYIKDDRDDAMPTFHPDLKSNKKLDHINFSVNDVRIIN